MVFLGYLQALKEIKDCQQWRDDIFWTEENDKCCVYYMSLLKTVYSIYSEQKKKNARSYTNLKFINIDEFREIMLDCNLVNTNFVERDMNGCFGLSIQTQIDELDQ